MMRQFTTKEAKNILDECQSLGSDYMKMTDRISQYKSKAANEMSRCITQGILKRHVLDELLGNMDVDHISEEISNLIYNIWNYSACRTIEKMHLTDEFEKLKYDMGVSARKLQACSGGLSWLLSGKQKKNDANKAYSDLVTRFIPEFQRILTTVISSLDQTDSVSKQYVLQKYKDNRTALKESISDLDIHTISSENSVYEIQALNDKMSLINKEAGSLATKMKLSVPAIEYAVDEYISKKRIDLLKEASIDNLNYDKRGIRLKNLRDAGYNTVADIIHATVYNLESITGISSDTARLLKYRADKYAQDSVKTVKIRLSADDRSQYATKLIKSLYPYVINKRAHKDYTSLLRERAGYLDYNSKKLNDNFHGVVSWIFEPEEKKRTVISAYRYLSETLTDEYIDELEKIASTGVGVYADQDLIWDEFSKNPIAFYDSLEEVVPGSVDDASDSYGLPDDLAQSIEEECFFPEGLKCDLRRYQEWGVKYVLHQNNALIGDEMGLGKTIQAIAVMVSLKNTGATHFIVVCPASVLTNWCMEITAKSKLRVIRIHGSDRKRTIEQWLKEGGVAVTTFETTAYFELEKAFKYTLMIVDEAHYIKNPEAIRTGNVKALAKHAERMLFMTGTALENRVDEMISLVKILNPAIGYQIQGMKYLASAPAFREAVAPVYFRRKREQVLKELPDLIETKEWCELSTQEKKTYEDTLYTRNFAAVRQVSWNVSSNPSDSCKARRLLELVDEAESEGRKVLVFSFFLDTISKVCQLLGDKCVKPINGSLKPQKRQEIIDQFDKAPAGTVLPAQIQSGGTGLNIQSASVVILCEPQFKPSIENQAISRAYRMGQSRNVLVYRLLCIDTVDEKIIDILEEKQNVFNEFADKSVAGDNSLELSTKSFGNIIDEEIERIKKEKKAG